MPAEVRPLNEYVFGPFLIADISTASQSQRLPCPAKGQVVAIKSAITTGKTGDAVLTVRKNGAAMTGLTQTVAGGAAAGAVTDTFVSPNDTDGYLEENDSVDIDTDGAGTGGGATSVFLVVRK